MSLLNCEKHGHSHPAVACPKCVREMDPNSYESLRAALSAERTARRVMREALVAARDFVSVSPGANPRQLLTQLDAAIGVEAAMGAQVALAEGMIAEAGRALARLEEKTGVTMAPRREADLVETMQLVRAELDAKGIKLDVDAILRELAGDPPEGHPRAAEVKNEG